MAATVTLAPVAAGMLLVSGPSTSTEQAEQRREARDTRQDNGQEAREAKVDRRAADQQGDPECRQDKPEARQEVRDDARGIKN